MTVNYDWLENKLDKVWRRKEKNLEKKSLETVSSLKFKTRRNKLKMNCLSDKTWTITQIIRRTFRLNPCLPTYPSLTSPLYSLPHLFFFSFFVSLSFFLFFLTIFIIFSVLFFFIIPSSQPTSRFPRFLFSLAPLSLFLFPTFDKKKIRKYGFGSV